MRVRNREEREDRDVRMELRSGAEDAKIGGSPGAVEGREMLRLKLMDLNVLDRVRLPSLEGGAVNGKSGSSLERAKVDGRMSERRP
jgi:hypothetical protein